MGLDLSLLHLFSAVVLLMAVEIHLYKICITKSFSIDDTYQDNTAPFIRLVGQEGVFRTLRVVSLGQDLP